ncbi:MAG: hypothetical protein MNSN_08140 [Minisyncoccus archaeiphilus]|uniref:hypothetical protein n=1 Tax=Minisyncoccus archaeiphilus TaxID=3238481 RepID=UPI002B14F175|nr:MAG: hypothetical protein MNSN_08140 [Candidatus Parcubacteria bacterium]
MAHAYIVTYKIRKRDYKTHALVRKLLKENDYYKFSKDFWIIVTENDINKVNRKIRKITQFKGYYLLFEITNSNFSASTTKEGKQWLKHCL